jgi:hypothetical protein
LGQRKNPLHKEALQYAGEKEWIRALPKGRAIIYTPGQNASEISDDGISRKINFGAEHG